MCAILLISATSRVCKVGCSGVCGYFCKVWRRISPTYCRSYAHRTSLRHSSAHKICAGSISLRNFRRASRKLCMVEYSAPVYAKKGHSGRKCITLKVCRKMIFLVSFATLSHSCQAAMCCTVLLPSKVPPPRARRCVVLEMQEEANVQTVSTWLQSGWSEHGLFGPAAEAVLLSHPVRQRVYRQQSTLWS